jgi:hypothetical protein
LPELTVFRTGHYFGRFLLFIRFVSPRRTRRAQRNNENLCFVPFVVNKSWPKLEPIPNFLGRVPYGSLYFPYKYLYANNTKK